tara:strand:- start:7287 stop:8009 length:723 start_codon:yes stop_codon:yes gene_type:complete
MPTVKLIEDESKLYVKGGKKSHTMNMAQLTVNSVEEDTIKTKEIADRGRWKVSFVEKLVWGNDDKDTFSDWSATFDDYKNNNENFKELSRGDTVNVILKFDSSDDGYFQKVRLIKKTNGGEVYNATESSEPVVDEVLPDVSGNEETVLVDTPTEDVNLPPEAEFRFAIPYHDRKNLSIQRQQSIKFALEYMGMMSNLDLGFTEETEIERLQEVQGFIWNGIQELWKDIPREVENEESSEK